MMTFGFVSDCSIWQNKQKETKTKNWLINKKYLYTYFEQRIDIKIVGKDN